MNKKATEEFLSPWNVLIWILMFGAVVSAIVLVNNAETDVRPAEAKLLALRLGDCLTEDGAIREEFFQEDNLLKLCSLEEKIVSENGEYYAKISLLEINTKKEYSVPVILGNKNLEIQCKIKEKEKNFAECYTQEIFLNNLNDPSGDYLLQITTASNNLGEIKR